MAYPFSLKCSCGVVIWQGNKWPNFCAISCPKCKKLSTVNKPKPPPKPEPIKMTVPGLPLETTPIHPAAPAEEKPIRMKA